MTNKTGLVAALAATTALVLAGVAVADTQAASTPPQTAVEKNFNKLSADGEKAFQDLMLTRVAIFDGDTAKAKSTIDAADTAFAKAKTDETVFMKSEHELMTPQQMAAKKAKDAAGATSTGATAGDQTAQAGKDKTAGTADASKEASTTAAKPAIAWLPVDGAVSLNEDYTLSPTKAKAVANANESLKKGDRKGALDSLKLADVDMSVALEVVPLQATLDDVHQAASLIDSGKYYEGSQMLRKVEDSARFDVSDYMASPKGVSAAHAKDTHPAADPKAATH